MSYRHLKKSILKDREVRQKSHVQDFVDLSRKDYIRMVDTIITMDNQMIFSGLGLIIAYFIFRHMTKEKKDTKDFSIDILNDTKYKVKGQWDK